MDSQPARLRALCAGRGAALADPVLVLGRPVGAGWKQARTHPGDVPAAAPAASVRALPVA